MAQRADGCVDGSARPQGSLGAGAMGTSDFSLSQGRMGGTRPQLLQDFCGVLALVSVTMMLVDALDQDFDASLVAAEVACAQLRAMVGLPMLEMAANDAVTDGDDAFVMGGYFWPQEQFRAHGHDDYTFLLGNASRGLGRGPLVREEQTGPYSHFEW